MPCVGLNKHVQYSAGETQHHYHPERRFTQLGSQYFVYVSCPSVKDRMQLCWTRFPLLYTFHFFFLVKEAIISHVHPPILVARSSCCSLIYTLTLLFIFRVFHLGSRHKKGSRNAGIVRPKIDAFKRISINVSFQYDVQTIATLEWRTIQLN